MEPDSLLVRGLVDNPSGGLSPALDRSTTFERAAGGGSPYGRGHAPVTVEAEALLGRARGRRGHAVRERHDGLDVPLPHAARPGQGARDPDQRLLRGGVARRGGARAASASRSGATTCATPTASGAPATEPRSRSSRAPPTRRSRSPTSRRPRRRPTQAGRCSAATTRSGRRCCSGRSTSAPISPGRAPRSTSRATPTCSQG